MNPLFRCDSYKLSHHEQYPANTEYVVTNWTPRYIYDKTEDTKEVIHFGLSYFIQKYLTAGFEDFFLRSKEDVISEYKELVAATLGNRDPYVGHIESLHELGYLPLKIYAIPEGFSTKAGVPHVVIVNTHPSAFWLPNFIESVMSNVLWMPSTSATTARRYRKLFEKYAREAGETNMGPVDYMGHDFSYRGLPGDEAAILSGMGHLTSFKGTDTIPAVLAARDYYGADLSCGSSVPATEHSVMCAGGMEGELETFRRLLKTYPNGPLSIVSDTWDLWRVLTEHLPALKNEIFSRNGKLVIRPDSGNPVEIICGNHTGGANHNHPSFEGVANLLSQFDTSRLNEAGYQTFNHTAMIYGDSITPLRAEQILQGLIAKKISPYNMVFGIGSFTYQYKTRDNYGFAMKATAVKFRGDRAYTPIFKNPITDNGGKKSHRGIPLVYDQAEYMDLPPSYFVVESNDARLLDECALDKVYDDGEQLIMPSFEDIRKRAQYSHE